MLPEVLQLGCSEVYAVDLGEDLAHGSINSPPLARLQCGEGDVAADTASTVLHQVERCAKGAGEAGWNRWVNPATCHPSELTCTLNRPPGLSCAAR